MTEKLPDGFYPDLDFSTYLAQGRLSKSVLLAHRKSGAHAKYAMTATTEPTAAMRAGTLAHTLILEPGTFVNRYAVGPCDDRRLKAWTEWAKDLSERWDMRERITPKEYEAGKAMTRWMETMPKLSALVWWGGMVEASVLWTDDDGEDTPLAFRARPDKLIPDRRLLLDLKTTTDLSDRAIARKIHDLGYHIQAALYSEGLAGTDFGPPERHAILWVETNPPYSARCTVLTEAWMDLAYSELAYLKAQHRACVKSGKWPGYLDGEDETLLVPRWMQDGDGDLDLTIGGMSFAA